MFEKGSQKQTLLDWIKRNPGGISFACYFMKAIVEMGMNMYWANYCLKDYREKGLVILYDEHMKIVPV